MNLPSQDSHFDLNLSPNHINSHSPQNFHFDLNVSLEESENIINTTTMSEGVRHAYKKKNLTLHTKQAVLEMLLKETHVGKLKRGVILRIANTFSISAKSVSRIWKERKNTSNDAHDFSSLLVKRVGRKKVQIDLEQIKNISIRFRTNIRSLAKKLGADKSTVHRRIKEGSIRPHSNALKPYLTDANKKARLQYCLSMINEGIWSFVYTEPAKRDSKNHIVGTLELKPILSVTKDVIRTYFLKKLLPSIREKWPASGGRVIYIQQDNARPHLNVNDPKFVEAGRYDRFDIRLSCQPANNPDMNVLDLGFFRAIDALQHQEAPTTIEEFVLAVQKAFDTFLIEDLNNAFLTLQSCMVEVMKTSGGNNYKIPHKLMKRGELPENVVCDFSVFNEAREALRNLP